MAAEELNDRVLHDNTLADVFKALAADLNRLMLTKKRTDLS